MDIVNCEIKFRCPKTWASLQDQGDPSIRFCESCQKHVYLCKTPDDVQRHVLDRHCVAFFEIVEEGDTIEFVGDWQETEKPSRRSIWIRLLSRLRFWQARADI